MSVYEKLLNVQKELKAPKGQYNSFGKYNYRNCEDILEAVKPICEKYKAVIILSDDVIKIDSRFYVKAVAVFIDVENGECVENAAFAREEDIKKGMDGSQITGASSSYARKYALNGLLCIDDSRDTDTTNVGSETAHDKKTTEPGPQKPEIPDFVPATLEQIRTMGDFVDAYADMCENATTTDVWQKLKQKYGFGHTSDISTEMADKIIEQVKTWYRKKKEADV